ncbi:hypothetical protein RFI_12175 [Reticulomyxa filosa]|uniref:SAM domain-containing protein n=1 Tax=Reticulomyxa filosa TaxID=46433 RepID=X6NF78_RETFI|nr:hypothetical protein RFI_12175 [Reticulomyxa filosa]|eukprot:ETO24970.1 hypothetical protein RFI_12175 [Reticulomyxa filosa]
MFSFFSVTEQRNFDFVKKNIGMCVGEDEKVAINGKTHKYQTRKRKLNRENDTESQGKKRPKLQKMEEVTSECQFVPSQQLFPSPVGIGNGTAPSLNLPSLESILDVHSNNPIRLERNNFDELGNDKVVLIPQSCKLANVSPPRPNLFSTWKMGNMPLPVIQDLGVPLSENESNLPALPMCGIQENAKVSCNPYNGPECSLPNDTGEIENENFQETLQKFGPIICFLLCEFIEKQNIKPATNNWTEQEHHLSEDNKETSQKIKKEREISEDTSTLSPPALVFTDSLSSIQQQWQEITDEEQTYGSLEEQEQQLLTKVNRKQFLQQQLNKWKLFLSRWKEWNINDLYNFLIEIDNRQFAKYFSSLEEFRSRWLQEQKRTFKGEDLQDIDREDLLVLGVTDKEERKLLAERIRTFREKGIWEDQCETKIKTE